MKGNAWIFEFILENFESRFWIKWLNCLCMHGEKVLANELKDPKGIIGGWMQQEYNQTHYSIEHDSLLRILSLEFFFSNVSFVSFLHLTHCYRCRCLSIIFRFGWISYRKSWCSWRRLRWIYAFNFGVCACVCVFWVEGFYVFFFGFALHNLFTSNISLLKRWNAVVFTPPFFFRFSVYFAMYFFVFFSTILAYRRARYVCMRVCVSICQIVNSETSKTTRHSHTHTNTFLWLHFHLRSVTFCITQNFHSVYTNLDRQIPIENFRIYFLSISPSLSLTHSRYFFESIQFRKSLSAQKINTLLLYLTGWLGSTLYFYHSK